MYRAPENDGRLLKNENENLIKNYLVFEKKNFCDL